MKVMGLIPARSQSRGVPGKNIRTLGGVPLIAHSIRAAVAASGLDRVIVSTDSADIASIAREYGAETPFLRPDEFADDEATDRDVMSHALSWLKENEAVSFDLLVYLRPTTPFKTAGMIDAGIEKMKKGDFTAVRSVTEVEGVSHPYWMYRREDDVLRPFVDGVDVMKDYYRRQLLPECYRLNGVIEVVDAARVEAGNDIYGERIGCVVIPADKAHDIDTQTDFLFCEFLMSRQGEVAT